MKNKKSLSLFLALCTTTALSGMSLAIAVKDDTLGAKYGDPSSYYGAPSSYYGSLYSYYGAPSSYNVKSWQRNELESFGKENAHIILKTTNLFALKVIEYLCELENGTLRAPTEQDLEIANKFNNYHQWFALETLGKDHADLASKITSSMGAKVIRHLCTREDGTLRTPTEQELEIANKFNELWQFWGLETLGKDHADLASKITSSMGAKVIRHLCTREDGTLRTPTEQELEIANKFNSYDQWRALEILGKDHAALALKMIIQILHPK